jgi:hypothetical protein
LSGIQGGVGGFVGGQKPLPLQRHRLGGDLVA